MENMRMRMRMRTTVVGLQGRQKVVERRERRGVARRRRVRTAHVVQAKVNLGQQSSVQVSVSEVANVPNMRSGSGPSLWSSALLAATTAVAVGKMVLERRPKHEKLHYASSQSMSISPEATSGARDVTSVKDWARKQRQMNKKEQVGKTTKSSSLRDWATEKRKNNKMALKELTARAERVQREVERRLSKSRKVQLEKEVNREDMKELYLNLGESMVRQKRARKTLSSQLTKHHNKTEDEVALPELPDESAGKADTELVEAEPRGTPTESSQTVDDQPAHKPDNCPAAKSSPAELPSWRQMATKMTHLESYSQKKLPAAKMTTLESSAKSLPVEVTTTAEVMTTTSSSSPGRTREQDLAEIVTDRNGTGMKVLAGLGGAAAAVGLAGLGLEDALLSGAADSSLGDLLYPMLIQPAFEAMGLAATTSIMFKHLLTKEDRDRTVSKLTDLARAAVSGVQQQQRISGGKKGMAIGQKQPTLPSLPSQDSATRRAPIEAPSSPPSRPPPSASSASPSTATEASSSTAQLVLVADPQKEELPLAIAIPVPGEPKLNMPQPPSLATLGAHSLALTAPPAPSTLAVRERQQHKQWWDTLVSALRPKAKSATRVTRFTMHYVTRPGQVLKIVGDHENLGTWEPAKGIQMTWTDGHVWSAEVELPANQTYFYKYVLQDDQGQEVTRWQEGNNRILVIPSSNTVGNGPVIEAHDMWNGDPVTSTVMQTTTGAEASWPTSAEERLKRMVVDKEAGGDGGTHERAAHIAMASIKKRLQNLINVTDCESLL